MRQTAENALDALGEQFIHIERLTAQVDASRKSGMQLADERRTFLARRDGDDLRRRMPQQDADQLQGRVTGTSEDGEFGHFGSEVRDQKSEIRSQYTIRVGESWNSPLISALCPLPSAL